MQVHWKRKEWDDVPVKRIHIRRTALYISIDSVRVQQCELRVAPGLRQTTLAACHFSQSAPIAVSYDWTISCGWPSEDELVVFHLR